MSRLTQARAGIPSAKGTGKLPNARKRTGWYEGRMEIRRAHDGLTPLGRDWRDGEPLITERSIYGRWP